MKIYKISQSISEETIKWWESYSQNMVFSSEEDAREWIRQRKEIFKKNHGKIFDVDKNVDENETRLIPIYKVSPTKYKIGKRRKKEKETYGFNTNSSLVAAQKENFSTTFGFEFGKKFSKCIYIDNLKLRSFDQIYDDNLKKIIDEIKNNIDQAPILIDDGYSILDGNHRHIAAKKLQIKMVPVVFYYDPKENIPEELSQ